MIRNKQNAQAALAHLISSQSFDISDKNSIQNALDEISHEPHRQHGYRVESMFGFVAAALNRCRLVKQEDSGLCMLDNENTRIPDYRLILKNSNSLFVEVKNCHELKKKFKQDYIVKLSKYAVLNNLPLKIAIYWSKPKVWTLVSVESFMFVDGRYTLDFGRAMAFNDMGLLGDRMIGALPPLKLKLIMDPVKTSSLDDNGQSIVVVGNTEIYCNDTLISDKEESNLAFQLIQFGTWEGQERVITSGNKVISIDYIYSPAEGNESPGQQFSIIGFLSSFISSKYDSHTVSEGSIRKLVPEQGPEKFQVPIPEGYKGKYLPLWQFTLKPNSNYQPAVQ